MGDFGRKNFRKVHSFDFVAMPDLATVFAATKNPDEILPMVKRDLIPIPDLRHVDEVGQEGLR